MAVQGQGGRWQVEFEQGVLSLGTYRGSLRGSEVRGQLNMAAWRGDKEEQAGSTECRPQWGSRLVRISAEGPRTRRAGGGGTGDCEAENWQRSRLLLIPGLV